MCILVPTIDFREQYFRKRCPIIGKQHIYLTKKGYYDNTHDRYAKKIAPHLYLSESSENLPPPFPVDYWCLANLATSTNGRSLWCLKSWQHHHQHIWLQCQSHLRPPFLKARDFMIWQTSVFFRLYHPKHARFLFARFCFSAFRQLKDRKRRRRQRVQRRKRDSPTPKKKKSSSSLGTCQKREQKQGL